MFDFILLFEISTWIRRFLKIMTIINTPHANWHGRRGSLGKPVVWGEFCGCNRRAQELPANCELIRESLGAIQKNPVAIRASTLGRSHTTRVEKQQCWGENKEGDAAALIARLHDTIFQAGPLSRGKISSRRAAQWEGEVTMAALCQT